MGISLPNLVMSIHYSEWTLENDRVVYLYELQVFLAIHLNKDLVLLGTG